MARELEEIDLTLSGDEDWNAARPPQPVTPLKCESESPRSEAVVSNNTDDYVVGGDGEGLKPATTGGKGLWSLWTRNFKSPLLMLLDLVDNAVDAAMQQQEENQFAGRVQIYRDLYEVMPGQTYTTGLCIRNNAKEIAPLKEVLQLFISAKANSGSDSIGENGVGLKQSCAALSDLSFVLVKNGTNKFELGIIAKVLQKVDGVFLPCFEFKEGDDGKSIGQQMLAIFTKPKYKEVADCIAEYGKVRSGGNRSLARGVARLSKHFENMNRNFFDNPNVFEVIVDKVMHHGKSSETIGADKNDKVRDIISELQHEIPRRYLHLNESFKFCVGKKELTFKYWPERLVEFTKIEIPVRSKIPWSEDFGEMTPDSYHLAVFLGFDRYRIADPETGIRKHKGCNLYVYSRACGRMVQYESDARTMLGLAAGGTDYCQALTVIIDDKQGHLPLDPTKQGVAFGNETFGHVHKENLYSIVSCVVKFYYQYHMKKYGKKKKILSAKIREFCSSDVPENLKTCGNSSLTDYGVRFIHTKDKRILVDHTFSIGVEQGPDTIFRLLPESQSARSAAKGKTLSKRVSKTAPSSPGKKMQAKDGESPMPNSQKDCETASDEISNETVTKALRCPTRKKRQAAKQKVAKADKSPAKKKRKVTKAPSAKRKQPAAKPCSKKKQCTAKTRLPPKMKGMRSSPRRSIGKPPIRYCDGSGSESDGDEEDDNDSTTNMESSEIKTEANIGVHDEDLIDLCSSSDEEDGERNSSNSSINESGDESEEAATDTDLMKIENKADEDGEEDQVMNGDDHIRADTSPNSLANESEENVAAGEAATHSNMIKFENTADEERELNISPNSLANENEMNAVGEETAIDSSAMKIENIALKNENTDLKARVSLLETENDSLEKEIKKLRDELEQSKRMVSVIRRRSLNQNVNDCNA